MTQKTVNPPYYISIDEELERIRVEAPNENWNGGGEASVTDEVLSEAKRFLSLLPSTPKAPEVSADADGEIEFEWYVAPRKVFSVSVGEGGRLTFAGLSGESVHHGVEYLGAEIPDTILRLIHRTYE